MVINNLKLSLSDFDNLEILKPIGSKILSGALWEYSCSLPRDKELNNRWFLGADPQTNSVFVLDYSNIIKPKIPFSYANKLTNGFNLWDFKISFDKAMQAGILTTSDLTDLAKGKQVNIKLSADEFINYCHKEDSKELTDDEKQKIRNMMTNPVYSDLDFSVDCTLAPIKISLDEFNQGLADGQWQLSDLSNDTWRIYEDSYCIVNDQKIHIIDWLKDNGFDAIVVKEDWAVNIICFYKNMIKAITNKNPTDRDNVYENYNYSDALLTDLL